MRNLITATIRNATVNPARASISGTAELKSPPKTIILLKPVVAQPCGVSKASVCIQRGVMKSGHQQPPIGENTSETRVDTEAAAFSVFASVDFMSPQADDISTVTIDRRIIPAGEMPRSILNAKMPTTQKMVICIKPLAAMPA